MVHRGRNLSCIALHLLLLFDALDERRKWYRAYGNTTDIRCALAPLQRTKG